MVRAGLSLAALLGDRVAAILTAVRGLAGAALPARVMRRQGRLGEIVLFSGAVDYIHGSFLMQIEQGVELSQVAPGPAAVVLSVGQDVSRGNAAFQ